MVLGFSFSIITGAGMPSMVFLLGTIIDGFSGNIFAHTVLDTVKTTIITMASIGAVIWFVTYVYFVSLVIMAERIGKKTRVAYLRSIL